MKSLAVLAVTALALTARAEFPQSQPGASQPGAPVAANTAPADDPEDLAEAKPEPTPDPFKVAGNRFDGP